MSDYRETVWAPELRQLILAVLARSPEYRSNSKVLRQMADGRALVATHSQVRTELAWLAEQGLVRADPVEDGDVIAATITERGLDVGLGRAQVPGVARPDPRP